MTEDPDRYLRLRGGRWHYHRRVPERFARLDGRVTIRIALRTGSAEIARLRRDELAAADDAFWASMSQPVGAGGPQAERQGAETRYRQACTAALAAGFRYKPIAQLVSQDDVEEVVRRLLVLDSKGRSKGELKPLAVDALLGTVEVPPVTVSEALDIYFREIAVDDQLGKSKAQAYHWQKVKRLSISYFIEEIGDLPLSDITREHALAYQRYWSARVRGGGPDDSPVKPNTANRHIGSIRLLYSSYFKHIGDEQRANPFRNLFFKTKSRAEVPAFPDDWVRSRILRPGALSGLRRELQLITYMLIETGCRPSEIINLRPEDIHLANDVPFISIRPRETREIKTEASVRDIPLVGVALEAARRAPEGFAHYHDRGELFSANMMKAFRSRNFFPSEAHVIYSFRHAFEKRMQEANIDYGLRWIQKRPRLHPPFNACAPSGRGSPRLYAGLFRVAQRRRKPCRPHRARSLHLPLHPSLFRRQRPHRAVPDERDDGRRRITLDHHPRRTARRIHVRPRTSERGREYWSVCRFHRKYAARGDFSNLKRVGPHVELRGSAGADRALIAKRP
jgi:integrase